MKQILKKDELLQLEITDMTDQGEGVGRHDGFAVFVKDAIPGDLVSCSVMKVKKTYAYARLQEVIRESPDRVGPRCPAARPCGGCQLQMMAYPAQLRFKEERVRSALARIGGFADLPVEPILAAPDPLRYRNKAQIPVGRDRDGRPVAGFYAGRTHRIIPVEDCLLGPEENVAITRGVLAWMQRAGVAPYDEESGEGAIRHILIRKGFATGEILVCLVVNAPSVAALDVPAPALAELGEGLAYELTLLPSPYCPKPRLAGLVVNCNPRRTNVILGDHTEIVWGRGFVEDRIGDLVYRISAESFYQVNPAQTRALYDKVREFAALTGEETVWDLYCGIGTIGLYLARDAGRVVGVEVVPRAVEDARENARANGIKNAEFICGDAAVADHEKGPRPSVVIVDPPRKGCDARLLQTILAASPQKVVYVSCDPATLARDLKALCEGGYGIQKVQPVDMFPQTVHVETVALLGWKGKETNYSYFDYDVDHHVTVTNRKK